MNPFNDEPLTADQLKKDTLCYLSVQQRQVKSSRLFLGHIHDVNVQRLSIHYNVPENAFKEVKPNEEKLWMLLVKSKQETIFFQKGIPTDFIDEIVDLNQFQNFDDAYHQLMIDITRLALESLKLVTPKNDDTKALYISGGFSRNDLFIRLLATAAHNKAVYTSEVDNATALGAALVIQTRNERTTRNINLGLKKVSPYRIKGLQYPL
jgi:hypothetical protein